MLRLQRQPQHDRNSRIYLNALSNFVGENSRQMEKGRISPHHEFILSISRKKHKIDFFSLHKKKMWAWKGFKS
jgi:hypothetical protein